MQAIAQSEGCELLPTKLQDEAAAAGFEECELCDEIESLIKFADAGFPIEINEFHVWKLFAEWRETEKIINQIFSKRMQSFITGFVGKQKWANGKNVIKSAVN